MLAGSVMYWSREGKFQGCWCSGVLGSALWFVSVVDVFFCPITDVPLGWRAAHTYVCDVWRCWLG